MTAFGSCVLMDSEEAGAHMLTQLKDAPNCQDPSSGSKSDAHKLTERPILDTLVTNFQRNP